MVGTEGVWIYIAASAMQVLVFGIYIKEMFGLKKNLYYFPIYWILLEVIANLFVIPQNSLIGNVIFNYCNYFLIAYFFAQGSWKKKAVLVALYFFVAILNEPLWTIVIVQMGISDAAGIKESYALVYAIYFLSQVVQLLFVQILSFVFKKKLFSATGQRHWIGVLVITLCSFGASFIQMVKMIHHNDYSWENIMSIILLCVINFVSYYFFIIGEDKSRLEIQYKSYEEQVKVYGQWIEEQKQTREVMAAFRHDMKNHIAAVKGICNMKLQEGQEEGFREIATYLDSIGTNYNILKNEVNSGNVLLDATLNMKINYAMSKGITAKADIRIPKDWQYDSMDMVIVLGNLLDNAIEACEQLAKDKARKLGIELKYDKGNLFLFLENTYSGSLDGTSGIASENQFPKTSKRDKQKHGIGMKNIAEVVQKYNGVMRWKGENEVFYTEVLLYGIEKS